MKTLFAIIFLTSRRKEWTFLLLPIFFSISSPSSPTHFTSYFSSSQARENFFPSHTKLEKITAKSFSAQKLWWCSVGLRDGNKSYRMAVEIDEEGKVLEKVLMLRAQRAKWEKSEEVGWKNMSGLIFVIPQYPARKSASERLLVKTFT